ncbi:MAG TPA: aldo/keto reductase, partial [Candidatus Polarisedimenticolia bacterium]|nr:aldo/keto reductase [Candidatus Polarisedimenticolia bacterium]
QDGCVLQARARGVNLFYFYDLVEKPLFDGLAHLVRRARRSILIASGSERRGREALRADLEATQRRLSVGCLDVFFTQYVTPTESLPDVFGRRGSIDTLVEAKREGAIRYVGASAHNRALAIRLIDDPRVDVVMHRFNMAHRKAAADVLPAARRAGKPLWAFTATRWSSLLEGHPAWNGPAPSAADCYRFCLAHPGVQAVVIAPLSLKELRADLGVLRRPPMGDPERRRWERYGDLVYGDGRDPFDTAWP